MITRYVELSCDHPDCDLAYAASPDELTSVRKTRLGAAVAGWTHANGKDYCPEHEAPTVAAIRELVAKRLTDKQIAARLGLSYPTVQKIRANNGIRPGLGRVGRPSGGAS